MKKTWNKILIIFSIIILFEVVIGAVMLVPHHKLHKIYSDISDGKWEKVKKDYDSFSETNKEELKSNLDGYANKLCNEYVEGKRTYLEMAASLDAINIIDASGKIYNEYMHDVSACEYAKQVDIMYEATIKFDSKTAFEAKNNIVAVQQRLDGDERERLLIEMMNAKYALYLNEEISEEDIGTFVTLVSDLALADAGEYVNIIINNVTGVEKYRKLYEDAVELNNQNNCLTVIEICDTVPIDQNDTLYKKKFEELRKTAYSCGKLYYSDRLDKEISDGNNALALKMMEQISKYYGDDFDTTKYKVTMAGEWQKQYLDLLRDVDNEIKNALNNDESDLNKDILSKYNSIKPNRLALYDIDGDDVPELFLSNDSYKGTCFVYSVKDDKLCFLGCHNILNLCDDGYLITKPLFYSGDGEVCILNKYEDGTFIKDSMCETIDKKYYVNGSQTNDVDYLKTQSSIMDHSNGKNVEDLKTVKLEEAESYVLSYK